MVIQLMQHACCLWFTQPIIAFVTANEARDSRQDSHINQQLCQLCSCTWIWARLVQLNWISSSPRVCVDIRLFHHRRGLVAGKNRWHGHECSAIWSTLIFRSGFCQWCRSTYRWLGSVVVGRWTRDREVTGSTPAAALFGQQPWASCSHLAV